MCQEVCGNKTAMFADRKAAGSSNLIAIDYYVNFQYETAQYLSNERAIVFIVYLVVLWK